MCFLVLNKIYFRKFNKKLKSSIETERFSMKWNEMKQQKYKKILKKNKRNNKNETENKKIKWKEDAKRNPFLIIYTHIIKKIAANNLKHNKK